MRHPKPGSSTFTLVELAVSLAIAMVLAALALPVFNHSILSSKRAEALTNVDGIDLVMVAYMAAEGAAPPDPVGVTYPDSTLLGRGTQLWAPTVPEWPLGTAWEPTGQVRCGYHHETDATSMAIYGVCDVNDTDRFYVEGRTVALDKLDASASATYCCTALYGSCVASSDCY